MTFSKSDIVPRNCICMHKQCVCYKTMCVCVTEENLKEAAAKWILKNREGHRIPNSVMESIVSGAKFLYETALSEVQQQVVDKLKPTLLQTPLLLCQVF